ncbi:MAG: ABC transporter ATP-binding protein [Alphaproteobacteria bacterium]|nr:ABC transporter ATP-binding protein [Alphaproteobacteria bacterium]
MSRSEFTVADAWTYDRRSPARWLVSHAVRYPGLLLGFFTLVLLGSVSTSSLPRLTGLAFDVVRGQSDAATLTGIALGMAGIAVLQALAELGSAGVAEVLAQRLERDARDELYVSLLGKSQTFHNRQRVGDIMARAGNDVGQLNPMINPGLALITRSALGLVVPIAFIAAIDLRLLLAPVLFVGVFALALRAYMRQLDPVTFAMRRRFGVMNAGLQQTLSGIEVVKSIVAEDHERQRFVTDARAFHDAFVEQGHVQARYLPTLLVGLAVAGGFAHGLYLLSAGQLTVGQLVAYTGLLGTLRFPAFISIFTFSLVQLGLAGAERILDLVLAETELDENSGGHRGAIRGEVTFEGVSFGYRGPEQQQALTDLSITVPAGTTVAVVGQTGSGKSTLTKLLNRTYDVGSGRILVDGVDVRDWNLESLRQQISVIEQDIFLFSRTIEENIRFGVASATREDVVRAAEAAQAHGFITGFEKGYDTVIGERGVTLSGGQRQRLAIARALLTDPRILVIDDATSAIDSATEDAIQRAIQVVQEGRTTFMITHRLSQIRRADQILVLERGQRVDLGTHDELLARCALYRRIFARYGEP